MMLNEWDIINLSKYAHEWCNTWVHELENGMEDKVWTCNSETKYEYKIEKLN